ncbi:telomere-associated protein RIF1-like [Penaeus monodon]|uniref:telomere-associated protein RIF1-like n=1 Tax=Penaeus monodon TaxID=6687 RepID=UPI0018A7AE46|nr:telomere-associated protein RIF1-like [Penaeus monodon]
MEDSLEELVEKCTAQKVSVRLPAYRALVQKCTESDEVVWSDYASQDDTQKTLSNLKADLFHENCDVSYEAAGLCGCLLANETFRSLLTKENEGQALDMLIKAIGETKEKKVLTRTLWSLGKSRLSQEVYVERLKKILETINNVLKVEDGSAVAVLEALQVFESLLKLIPDEMNKETKEWFPNVFVFLFHDALRVRMSAFACISIGRSFLITEDLKSDILKLIIPDLKAKHCKTMNRLIGAECTDVLKEWRLIVEILGKELHPGTSLINGLLEVVEKGFKSVKAEIRIEAFKCWQSLIDNFSLDEAVLTHSKRLKLLLAPLKANNAKTEDIALAKLLSWWHLVCKLGKKATSNFDLVIAPLLRFCFGCGAPASGAASGLSERNLIMSGAAASPGRKFSGLHVTCAEILGQILSTGLNISGLQPFSFTTPILEYPVIPNQVLFIRNYQFFMSCVKEAVQSLNSQERKQCLLGIFLFQSVLAHLRVVITTDVSKKDSVEPVKELFTIISAIESQCRPGDSQSQFVYKFLELVIVGSLGLPKTVLNSRQYHISTGNTMRDMMSGTLNNYLIHELCKPTLLHYATSREGYFTMWLEVLANSRPATGKLGLLQSVVKELDAAAPILCPAHPNTLARLWSSVVNQLLQHIEETQVIDQGDGSEHDWSLVHSPAKPRKKPHALHNLAGSVALIGILLNRVLRMVSNQRQHAASRLCEALTQIFKGVQQEKIINSLVLHVVDTLAAALQVNPAAKFGVEVEKKFISMFKSFGSLLDEHFGRAISSDQFIKLVPLLTVSLSSTNKHIKQEAKRIWRNNFSEIKQDIPSELFERLKECSLPPASLTDPHEDAEESLSLSPKENVPTHIAGSFLNREMGQEVMHKITPKGKSQKFETPKSLKASQGTPIIKDKSKRKINLEDMNDEEFVKVSSPKPSRRVLTEHQIERMTERRSDIPALYSDLSQSMSQAVLPTQFSSQNSFEESSSVNTEKSREKLDEAGQKTAKSMQAEEREDDKKEEKEASIETNPGELSFSGLFPSENQEPEISKESEKKSERNTKAKFEKPKPKTKKKFQQEIRAEEVDSVVTDNVEETLKSRTVEESKDLNKVKADEDINGGESIKEQESSAKNNTKKGKGVKENVEDRKTRSKSKESFDTDEKSISKESESRESLNCGKKGDNETSQQNRSLDSMSSDSGDSSVTEQNRRKSQTPVKKTVEDVRKSLKGKEVAVSPSVVKDCKIVNQIPEVKLINNAGVLHNRGKISDSDSEEEIPNSQVEEPKQQLLVFNIINKEKEDTPGKNTRKRVNESVSHSIGGKQSSSEDSVIIIDEKGSSDSSSEKKSDGGVEVKNIDKNIKRNKKTRSQLDTSRKSSQSSQNSENVHDSEGLPSTPPKVTRSGRKVVAPNKDMPEPMTPPGSASQKRRSKSQESLSVSYVGDDVPKVTEKLNSTSPKDHVPSTRRSVQKKITDMFVKDDGDSQDVDDDSLPEMEDMDCDTVHSISDSENDEVPLKSMPSAAPEKVQECDKGDNQEKSVIEKEESKVSEELFETSCVEILNSEVNENKTSDNEEISDEEVEVEQEHEAKSSESGKPLDVDEFDDEETLDADEIDNQNENKESKDHEVESENLDDSDKCDTKQNMAETAVEDKEEEIEDFEKRDGESMSEDPVNSFENGQALNEEIKEIDKEPTRKSNKDKDRFAVETLTENNSLPRQQEDELSPEKPVRSKLSTAVGTPERQKKFGALKCAGSRAAMLVACAKQNMKNRGTSDGDSPTKSVFGSDGTRNRLGGSPIRRSAPGRMSPASTPPNRKRKFGDSDGGKPWVKHEPSPGASPSTSILKKPALDDVCNDTPSPPPSKQRRVSFADPPVSDRVEIPPSPKTLRGLRAQKRLDMTKAASPIKDDESQSQNESQEGESQVSFDCSQPLYPSLVNCTENLDAIISQLTSAGLIDGLKKVLEDLGVTTVGQFCQLTEADVNKLPVRAPKVSSTLKVIKKYDETKSRESKKSTEPVMDEVEAQLSQIFAEDDREDKENQRPNNQAKVKKSIDEVSAVLMDDVIEDSLENMEPEEDNQIDADCSNDLPPRLGDEDLEVDDDVMPLDPSPDNADEVSEPVSAVCRHIAENPSAIEDLVETLDLEAKKTLFSSLLNKLRYPFVIGCYYEYLKNRESDTNT